MHYLYRYVCILNVFFYICTWTIVYNKEFIIIIYYIILLKIVLFGIIEVKRLKNVVFHYIHSNQILVNLK